MRNWKRTEIFAKNLIFLKIFYYIFYHSFRQKVEIFQIIILKTFVFQSNFINVPIEAEKINFNEYFIY